MIPADFRAALHLEIGDSVALSCEQGELRVTSIAERIRRIQEHVKAHAITDPPVVEEFLKERREAAALE